jgi:hypothetical protein
MRQPRFPIDAVFTWVDGADPVWLEQKRALRRTLYGDRDHPGKAEDPARFRDNGELRYALRSFARHAPWIRTVHLVTADQKPVWLDTENVHLVSHRDIFPEDVPLPVFSTRPIEFCLHRVPDLAEHFLCCNDDFLLGRDLFPGDFFLPGGEPLLWVVRRGRKAMEKIRSGLNSPDSHNVVVARSHMLARERYGSDFPYTMRHFPKAMTRASAAALWEAFPAEIRATLRAPFRSPDDVSVTMLYPLYALAEGIGRARVINGARQILDAVSGRGMAHIGASLGDRNAPGKMAAIRRFRPRTFCLNDAPGASDEDRRQLADFLAALFPEPCKYEVQT